MVPENIHTPTTEEIGNFEGVGGSKKIPYPHHRGNWKFRRGGGRESKTQEIPEGGGRDCMIDLVSGGPLFNRPNANMADHSVIARDELHESEASEASVFCFDNASPEKSCFVDGLVCFTGLLIFRVVAEPRISTKSAKSRENHQNTRNPAKSARNLTKYMSAQYI